LEGHDHPDRFDDSKRPRSERNPYALDNPHPSAKARMNRMSRLSRAYIVIMKVREATP
jgi:hypothetical protein